MKQKKLEIRIGDLRLWSLNPRLDHELRLNNDFEFNEDSLIDEIWSSVGSKQMEELVAYISSKGLYEDETIIVVKNKKHYDVYDGNRRVAALKKIIKTVLPSKEKYSENSLIDAVVMSDVDAYDRILIKHGGSNALKMISWDAVKRDVALSRGGGKPKYPKAFDYYNKGFIVKKQFEIIKYTELEGVLRNSVFMMIALTYTTESQLVDDLKLMKKELGFSSFSRYLIGISTDDGKQLKVTQFFSSKIPGFDAVEPPKNGNGKVDLLFSLSKKKYKFPYGFKVNLVKHLEFTVPPLSLNTIVIDCDTLVITNNVLSSTVAPNTYKLNVRSGQSLEKIEVQIFEKKELKLHECVIRSEWYNRQYSVQNEISKPVGYLLKFLSTTEVSAENIYALTILTRQYLEFIYKIYCAFIPDGGKKLSTLNVGLATGINSINTDICNKTNILDKATRKIVNGKVDALITLVQNNSHNMKSIKISMLTDLLDMLCPIIEKMTDEIVSSKKATK